MALRGIRGAITVDDDDAGLREAVDELLAGLVGANDCRPEDLAAAIFTVTDDLAGANPAAAARAWGWGSVPLLVVREHPTDAEVPLCVRVLVLWNTTRPQDKIRHVYLRGARALRPDLTPLSLHASPKDDVR